MTILEKFIREKVLNPIADNPLDVFPYFQNLGKWESKVNPILYITGISGGGKGFVAKNIASKYPNTIIFELDKFENYPWYRDTKEKEKSIADGDSIIYAWIDDNFDTRTDFFMNSPHRYQQLMGKLYAYLLEYTETHSSHRYIMEGVQLYSDPCFKSIDRDDSVIIIKTTKVFSMQKNLDRPHAVIRNRFHHGIGATKLLQNLEARLRDPSNSIAMEDWARIDDHPAMDFGDIESMMVWMKKHFVYDSACTTLPTVEQMIKKPLGNCHAQVLFEEYFLDKMGYSYKPCFCMEVGRDGQGGMTHSWIVAHKAGQYTWIENAWEDMAGCHPVGNFNATEYMFRRFHDTGKWGNKKRYPIILFGGFHGRPGDTLQQIVDRSLN